MRRQGRAGAAAVAGLLLAASGAVAQEPPAGPPGRDGVPIGTAMGPATVRVGGEVRVRREGLTWTPEDHGFLPRGVTEPAEHLLLVRTRLFAIADLHPRLSARVGIQWSRAEGTGLGAPEDPDRVDTREAFVEWRSGGTRGLRIALGRFPVPAFGDERILGDDEWSNRGRVLDGARVTYGPGPVRLHVLATRASATDPVPPLAAPSAYAFGGVVAEIRALPWLDLDGYALGRAFQGRDFAGDDATGAGHGRKDDVTLGLRAALRVGPLGVTADLYGQAGRQGGDDVRAWATAQRIAWRVWQAAITPTLWFEHTYASGDARPGDGRIGTFDPLFADAHSHHGPYDAVGWRNVQTFRAGGTFALGGKAPDADGVRVHLEGRGSFLASQRDAWYGADGRPVLRDDTGHTASSRTLEGELDAYADATLANGTIEVQVGLAHWCPNNLIRDLLPADFHGYRIWTGIGVRF